MTLSISSEFDGGNIVCQRADRADDIGLTIATDAKAAFFQWFYFRLTGARGRDCTLRIENAGKASYPSGWTGYRAVVSEDRRRWTRAPTSFDGTVLTIRYRPKADAAWFAYFAPYSMERHADLIAWAQTKPPATLHRLGRTVDGQDLDLLEIGRAQAVRTCWVIGRQHPGETMAEWWMEGFLRRLLDPHDALARSLLARARFFVVPNMNPDGSRRGHLRANAAGVNLNRAWQDPDPKSAPEVHLVRGRMAETGVDFCLDVHGDEGLPYAFIAGADGIPSLTARQTDLLGRYQAALVRANPEFQTAHGYPVTAPGKANLAICTNYIAETFGCLAMTLEQPFKDAANAPDLKEGWSPARCQALGASNLDGLAAVIDDLR